MIKYLIILSISLCCFSCSNKTLLFDSSVAHKNGVSHSNPRVVLKKGEEVTFDISKPSIEGETLPTGIVSMKIKIHAPRKLGFNVLNGQLIITEPNGTEVHDFKVRESKTNQMSLIKLSEASSTIKFYGRLQRMVRQRPD